MTLASLGDLTDLELAAEIAALQWEMVIEAAQAAHATPVKERGTELTRLARSTSILDRYAAQLARQWIEDERTR